MVYRWYFPHVPGIQFYMCFFVSLYIYIYIWYPLPKTDLFAALTSLTPIQLAMALQCHCKLDGFKIQDSQRLFWANLESKSWIQPLDSRFKIPGDSFQQILNPGFKIQDSQGLFAGNLESRIQDGFKICSKEFLGILNLESRGWIQDLLQRVPGNLESWIQWLDSRFAPKSSWEYWILKFRPEK